MFCFGMAVHCCLTYCPFFKCLVLCRSFKQEHLYLRFWHSHWGSRFARLRFVSRAGVLMQLYFCPNSFRTYFQNCFVFSCFKVKVTRRKLITYASINVKPEGGGGGGPRVYVGHLTSIAFPTLGNFTKNLGPRVGTFTFFARRNGTKSHRTMCSSVRRSSWSWSSAA